jgi:hypothetical protein
MGDIAPSKMPKGVRKARRDDTDFTQYAEGGAVKRAAYIDGDEVVKAAKRHGLDHNSRAVLNQIVGRVNDGDSVETAAKKVADKNYAEGGKVNAAGNYTKPELRKRIVSQVKAAATQGTGAGKWSARKAQLVAKKYKAAGGSYRD